MRAAFGAVARDLRRSPAPHGATVLGLPGPRYRRDRSRGGRGEVCGERLARHAVRAPFPVWQWLTIRAGVPVVTAPRRTSSSPRPRIWDVLGGVNFRQGLLHRTGDHRADAIPRAAQGAAVRVPCDGDAAAAAGPASSLQRLRPNSPAARSWSMRRRRPAAEAISSPSCRSRRRNAGDCASARPMARRSSRCRCRMSAAAAAPRRGGATCAEPQFGCASRCSRTTRIRGFRSSSPRTATSIMRGPRRPRVVGRGLARRAATSTAGGTWLGVTRTGACGAAHECPRAGSPRSGGAVARSAGDASARRAVRAAHTSVAAIVADAAGIQRIQSHRRRHEDPHAGARTGRRTQARSRPVSTASRTRSSTPRGRRSRGQRLRSRRGARRDADDVDALFAVLGDRTRTPDALTCPRPACRSNGSAGSPRRSSSARTWATARAARRS